MNRHALLTRAALVLATTAALWWPAQASNVEPTASAALSGQQTVGSSLFRYWGFEVYQATLHAAAGFDAKRFEQQRFGLSLQYRRAFKGSDIAQRSIDEMQAIAGKLKYALIVIASIPPLLAYPFVQKHFVKGMMIGSVKG